MSMISWPRPLGSPSSPRLSRSSVSPFGPPPVLDGTLPVHSPFFTSAISRPGSIHSVMAREVVPRPCRDLLCPARDTFNCRPVNPTPTPTRRLIRRRRRVAFDPNGGIPFDYPGHGRHGPSRRRRATPPPREPPMMSMRKAQPVPQRRALPEIEAAVCCIFARPRAATTSVLAPRCLPRPLANNRADGTRRSATKLLRQRLVARRCRVAGRNRHASGFVRRGDSREPRVAAADVPRRPRRNLEGHGPMVG